MNTTKIFLCVALTMTLLHSCRQEDDYIRNYAGNDALTMDKASKSFGNEFDALWEAVNTNYVAWEIETVNWDEVYDTYKPKFVELDTLMAHGQTITDADFTALYKEVLDTLHDGHSYYVIKNLSTGNYTEYIYPQKDRNIRRFGKNYNMETAPFDPKALTQSDFPESKCMHVTVSSKTPIKAHLKEGITTLEKAEEEETTSSDEKVIIDYEIEKVYDLLRELPLTSEQEVIEKYNVLALSLKYAKLPLYSTNIEYPVEIMSAISNDGIAYLRFSEFCLTPYLSLTDAEVEAMTNKDDVEMYTEVRNAWRNWFDSIQTMGKDLKGVIIDVRNNGGGMNSDQAYTLGALLPSGGYKVGTYKTKIGTGRLDYSIDMDFMYETMNSTHVVVTDQPIVVLCDHSSASNAETVSLLAKMLPNGIVVGRQTYGAMSCLWPGQDNYSITYGGEFGVKGTSAIYGYQPLCLANYSGSGVLESKGVTPTEGYDLKFDSFSYAQTHRDNQLEAALKAIRGK